ncbi:MAG: diguanylate cyclase [bacterium]|nr:diguanylate cyclase [bacterium]
MLVVDDEDTLRTVISQVLIEDGHDVAAAASAEEALELFRENPFPLVITDIIMGKMSGLELLREVKELESETLVVVMTSHASLETACEALRHGAYDFLVKPFDEIDLVSAVVKRATDRIDLIRANQDLMQRLKSYATDLERLNEQLKSMANRDGLTGLFNRRYLNEALEREFSRSGRHAREFSLVLLDVDHFKHYNDTHGHLAGDEALRTVAEVLQERCRKSTIAARYGGEEFVLLIPETDKEGAEYFAGMIRGIVEEHAFPGEDSQPLGKVTVSMGVATFPEDAADITGLIDCADKALYQAKKAGRNAVITWQAPTPV